MSTTARPAKHWLQRIVAVGLVALGAILLVPLRGFWPAPSATSVNPLASAALITKAAEECKGLHIVGTRRPPDWRVSSAKIEGDFQSWESKPPPLTKRPPATLVAPLPEKVLADLCRLRAGLVVEGPDELLSWLLPRLTSELSREQVLAYLGEHHQRAPISYRVQDRTAEAFYLRPDRELRLIFDLDGRLVLAFRTFGPDPQPGRQ